VSGCIPAPRSILGPAERARPGRSRCSAVAAEGTRSGAGGTPWPEFPFALGESVGKPPSGNTSDAVGVSLRWLAQTGDGRRRWERHRRRAQPQAMPESDERSGGVGRGLPPMGWGSHLHDLLGRQCNISRTDAAANTVIIGKVNRHTSGLTLIGQSVPVRRICGDRRVC
jgi:hypothetical protein